MSWVRIDDSFSEHRKVMPLSANAFRLYVEALCFANRNATDGHLTALELSKLWRRGKERDELVNAGLWERLPDGGFAIHDYAKYNPTRAQVEARREAVAEKVRNHRRKGERNQNVTGYNPGDVTEVCNHAPVPARPGPSRTSKRSPDDPGSARAPTGEHAELVEHFRQRFRDARGEDPPWTGRDFKDLKKLREKHGLERAKGFIDRAFADEFWRSKVTVRAIAEDPGRFVGNGRRGPSTLTGDALMERARRITEQEICEHDQG